MNSFDVLLPKEFFPESDKNQIFSTRDGNKEKQNSDHKFDRLTNLSPFEENKYDGLRIPHMSETQDEQ